LARRKAVDIFTARPGSDRGDRLHPGDAGCQAMADAIDLSALLRG
jgi:hypothetical protein